MKKEKISIYSTFYHLIKNDYLIFLDSIINFSKFAGPDGEVILASNLEGIQDGSNKKVESFLIKNGIENVKIVISENIFFNQNTFDGDLKNFALQKTSNPIKIQMDLDEIFVLSQKEKWKQYFSLLLNSYCYEAIFVPSIDLYGSVNKIRKNHLIGQKWRIHKNGLKRGVWKNAKLDNGLFDTKLSDSGELLSFNDELVSTGTIIKPEYLIPENSINLNNYIYTLHLGYLNLEYRKQINNNWWKQKWEDRSNKNENVVVDIQKLLGEEVIDHNLLLF